MKMFEEKPAVDSGLDRRLNAAHFIGASNAWKYRILPVDVNPRSITVGRATEFAADDKAALEREWRRSVVVQIMPDDAVVAGIRALFPKVDSKGEGGSSQLSVDDMFDEIVEAGLDEHVGDMHFQWGGVGEGMHGEVLFRIDRALYPFKTYEKTEFESLIRAARGAVEMPEDEPLTTKTKVYNTHTGRSITLRVQSIPDYRGDVVIIRLIGATSRRFRLSDLMLPGDMDRALRTLIRKPGGIVLTVGPPHSGKTTLMWSLVDEIVQLICKNGRRVKILSAEDAVEVPQEHAVQVEIAEERGITYPKFLTGANRSDVDIVVQGEIPDVDSAFHTFQLALSTRYMFASLHARDAYSALLRLLEWEIPSSVLASGLRAIIVQRLVPLLCEKCKKQTAATEDARAFIKATGLTDISPQEFMSVYTEGSNPKCERCHGKGTYGSRAILEVVPVTRHLLRIVSNPQSDLADIDDAFTDARRCATGQRGRNLTLAVQAAALFIDGQISEDAMFEAEINAEVGDDSSEQRDDHRGGRS